jgi:hypothetical protein
VQWPNELGVTHSGTDLSNEVGHQQHHDTHHDTKRRNQPDDYFGVGSAMCLSISSVVSRFR